jgi:hypothetical protein
MRPGVEYTAGTVSARIPFTPGRLKRAPEIVMRNFWTPRPRRSTSERSENHDQETDAS